jgi:hypothetical protein
MPDGLCGSLSPIGYLPLGAGYFFAASAGVIGVATGAPPAPFDPGVGAAAAWLMPGCLAYSPPPPVLPWPTAVLEKNTANPPITTTIEIIVSNFVFIFIIETFATYKSDGCFARQIQKRLNQLRGNPPGFFYFVEPVFFFENAKFVQLHFAKQTSIKRAHDLGRHH